MRSKYTVYIFLLLLLLLAVFIANRNPKTSNGDIRDNNRIEKNKAPNPNGNRGGGLIRNAAHLQYSKHARCRMDCRHISTEEVRDILQHGTVNYKKSDLHNSRCPRYAVEGTTSDAQHVRIVFAQCSDNTVVVTAIDLDTHWQCHCPGDE